MSADSSKLPYRDLPEFIDQLVGDLMSAWSAGSTEQQVADEMDRMLTAHLESGNGRDVLRRTLQPKDTPVEACSCDLVDWLSEYAKSHVGIERQHLNAAANRLLKVLLACEQAKHVSQLQTGTTLGAKMSVKNVEAIIHCG